MNRGRLEQWDRKMPEAVKRIQLQLLMLVTAKAFRKLPILLLHLPSEIGLNSYAASTREWMNSETDDMDLQRLEKQLHEEALRAGNWMRNLLGFRDNADIRLLLILLYRNIGIELEGPIPGEFVATQCYFSREYTPKQCRFMSNMDSGIIEGLFGGGELYFTERITEGCSCCKACFRMGEKQWKEKM